MNASYGQSSAKKRLELLYERFIRTGERKYQMLFQLKCHIPAIKHVRISKELSLCYRKLKILDH